MLLLSSMTPLKSSRFDVVREQRIADLQGRGLIPITLPDGISDLCGWVAALLC